MAEQKVSRRWFVRGEYGREFFLWQGKSGYVQLWQEWSEWFSGHYNWQNFTVIELAYEDEGHTGHREVMLGLLGLRARIQWCYNPDAEGMKIVTERMAEIKAHPDLAVDFEKLFGDKDE